jgi:hypothetical protein
MTAAHRYAIYWAPELAHPLWRAGCEWLGRDAADASFPGSPREATATPRRYGFHATLKAPIVLREEAAAGEFLDAVEHLAARTSRFVMPALSVQAMGDFIALRPVQPVAAEHPLQQLADACVRQLDPWRAPPGAAERARRSAGPALSAAQARHLNDWGYPHVFDQWRFHMTLTDALPGDAALRERWMNDAQQHFSAALAAPLLCDSVCVFTEATPGADAMLTHRFRLAP